MLTNIISSIRKIAKSNDSQTLFTMSKEIYIKLFRNDTDFTDFQIIFLKYLNFYSIISLDIALGDIDEEVLDNNIYEDSYMFYRNKVKNKEKNTQSPNKPPMDTVGSFSWVFPKKGK